MNKHSQRDFPIELRVLQLLQISEARERGYLYAQATLACFTPEIQLQSDGAFLLQAGIQPNFTYKFANFVEIS